MKKILSISAIVLVIVGIVAWLTFSFLSESLAIKNIKSENIAQTELSKNFSRTFTEIDYMNIYNTKNDVIVVDDLNGPTVKYYSTRNLSAEEAGYIQACIRQAGNEDVYPYITEIYSEVSLDLKFNIEYETVYRISSVGDTFNNKPVFATETIQKNPTDNKTPRLNVPVDFTAKNDNGTIKWENQAREEMYISYKNATIHFDDSTKNDNLFKIDYFQYAAKDLVKKDLQEIKTIYGEDIIDLSKEYYSLYHYYESGCPYKIAIGSIVTNYESSQIIDGLFIGDTLDYALKRVKNYKDFKSDTITTDNTAEVNISFVVDDFEFRLTAENNIVTDYKCALQNSYE